MNCNAYKMPIFAIVSTPLWQKYHQLLNTTTTATSVVDAAGLATTSPNAAEGRIGGGALADRNKRLLSLIDAAESISRPPATTVPSTTSINH